MERVLYDRMAEHDATHWWYRARRDVLASVIERRIAPTAGARILEIGCGTGHNLAMLGRFGTVDAIELDLAARAVAAARLGRLVGDARLPELHGIAEGQYDLVALLDVLEHVADDVAALRSIAARLRPGGRVLLTVPQYGWMWSGHDVANHHHRRYSKRTLRSVIDAAGLNVHLLQNFNSLLFPLAAASRIVDKLRRREGSDDALPHPLVNALFERVFAFERHMVGRSPMPPGVSLVAVLSASAPSER